MASRQPHRSQSQRRAESTDAIVRAAVDVIALRGFQHAKLQEIADLAQMSKGGIHHHFRAKEDLAPAVITHCIAVIRAQLRALIPADAPAADRLRRAIRAAGEAQRHADPAIRALTAIVLAAEHEPPLASRIAPVVQQAEREIVSEIESLLAAAGLRARIPTLTLGRMLIALALGNAALRPLLADDASQATSPLEHLIFALVTV